MTFDLTLGFRQIPADLAKALAAVGFTLERVVPKVTIFGVTMEYYEFYDADRSTRAVHFVYHNGTYPDHHQTWKGIVEDPNMIVATGSLTTSMGRSAFDKERQLSVGRFLRDHFGALLYDPQSDKIVVE